MINRRILLFASLGVLSAGGCVPDLEKERDRRRVQSIAVSPGELTLNVGQSSRLVASAQYKDGRFEDLPTPLENLTWRTQDESIAGVFEDGTVEGRAPGSSFIYVDLRLPDGSGEEGKSLVFSNMVQAIVGGGEGLRIDSVIPDHGPRSGSSGIRIEGAGFVDVFSVRIGQNELIDWRVANPNLIQGQTPPFTGGPQDQDVIVQTSRDEARLTNGFYYDDVGTPVITMISPPRVTEGAEFVELTILGMNFNGETSQVRMSGDGFSRDLNLVGAPQTSTELHAELPAGLSPGTYGIVVTNGPGGEPSPSFNFFVDPAGAAIPRITALSPARIVAGSPEFQLNITGTGFDNPVATFNGEPVIPPTPGSSTVIVVTIPDSLVALPGRYPVVVQNFPGAMPGPSSSPFDFIVDPPGMSTGFDANGVIVSDPGPGDDDVTAIATDGSVSFYVAGNADMSGDRVWRIEKRSIPGGELDSSFGTGGVLTVNPSSGADFLADIAIDSTHMYLAGADFSPGSGNDQWRIEKRSLSTGQLDPSFNGGGALVNNLSGGLDEVTGIAIDATGGSLFIFGLDSSNGDRQWRLEKRSAINGGPDPGYPSGGVTINPSSGHDDSGPILLTSGTLYIGGIDRMTGQGQWRVEARSAADGSLFPSFNAGGVLTIDPGSLDDRVHALAVHDGQLYIAGVDTSLGFSNEQWRVEKRRPNDAALDPDFGSGGVVRSNPTGSPDAPSALAFDPAGNLYIGGYDGAPQDRWRIERRETFGGTLDMSFAQGGVLLHDSPGLDRVVRLLGIGDFIYAIGSDSTPGNRAWRIQRVQGQI